MNLFFGTLKLLINVKIKKSNNFRLILPQMWNLALAMTTLILQTTFPSEIHSFVKFILQKNNNTEKLFCENTYEQLSSEPLILNGDPLS